MTSQNALLSFSLLGSPESRIAPPGAWASSAVRRSHHLPGVSVSERTSRGASSTAGMTISLRSSAGSVEAAKSINVESAEAVTLGKLVMDQRMSQLAIGGREKYA